MDDLEPDYSNNLLDNFDLEIDEHATASIKGASKWAKFISIVMFFFCGLMLLVLVFAIVNPDFADSYTRLRFYGDFIDEENRIYFISFFLLIVMVIATIYYFLLNFARKVKVAVITENTEELNRGLNSLKIYFIIYTALGLLSVSLSVIALIKFL
jgi:hypothetical protein